MLIRIAAWLCLALGVSLAASAAAEPYRVIGGELVDTQTGVAQPLRGGLEVSLRLPDQAVPPATGTLLIDDFLLNAGDQSLEPRAPVLIDGRPALELRIADQIQFEGEDVTFANMQAKGEFVSRDENTVTLRYLELRSDGGPGNALDGQLGDTGLPRRISLAGSVHEIFQSYRLPLDECPVVELPPFLPIPPRFPGPFVPGPSTRPPTDGGIIFDGNPFGAHGVTLTMVSVPEVTLVGVAAPSGGIDGIPLIVSVSVEDPNPLPNYAVAPAKATAVRRDAPTTPADRWHGFSVVYQDPGGGDDGAGFFAQAAPTLESLGITAPSGATVEYDETTQALTITSEGDLLIAGGLRDLPDISSLTIETLGSVTIDGTLELPAEITLRIDTGGDLSGGVTIGGLFVPPEDIRVPPYPPIVVAPVLCTNPLPIFPNERNEIGSFHLIASTGSQPVEIEAYPRRINPFFSRFIRIAILGSDELDVRDVVPESLRLGEGEAPALRFGRHRSVRFDINRDGKRDLLALFSVREARIAIGDTEVCLTGETPSGAIEGCTPIDTRPRVWRWRWPWGR